MKIQEINEFIEKEIKRIEKYYNGKDCKEYDRCSYDDFYNRRQQPADTQH